MSTPPVSTVDILKDYLHHALMLEHATIPPYLTALYSIHPGTNREACETIRIVLVEEMLHLTLAANLLNAIGGTPAVGTKGFMPPYPTYLPDGETDFEAGLGCFSKATIETFMKIERPSLAPDAESRRVAVRRAEKSRLGIAPDDDSMDFYSIGDFYMAIEHGFEYLYEQMGDDLFCGDPARQVPGEYFYSGGGSCFPVTDMASAKAAIDLIIGQGEGAGGGIYNSEHELAHYFRFEQLMLGRYYKAGDEAHKPTGPELEVDWDAVFPLVSNPRIEQFDGELKERAESFNEMYAKLLLALGETFDGAPARLLEAVPMMFQLRSEAGVLMRNPLPGSSAATDSAAEADGIANGAPTFEVDPYLPAPTPA